MQKLSQNNIPSKNILTVEKNVKSITKYLKWRDNAQEEKICRELVRKHKKKKKKKTLRKTERNEMRCGG
jgi:hypothetical protein